MASVSEVPLKSHFSLGATGVQSQVVRSAMTCCVMALAATALLIATSATAAHAQGASATLTGTVTDESGAVIPDARIVIRNLTTASERHLTTNNVGSFAAAFLPPGNYAVIATHEGFATGQVKDIVVNINDQVSIAIQLKVQVGGELVTVTAEPSRSNVALGVGTVVGHEFIANMPLNGRSLQALLQLVPGVVLTSNTGSATTGYGPTSGGQFSVNGQRTTSNYVTVDGVSANTGMNAGGNPPGASGSGQTVGTTALGATNSLVALDALQEFRIETSTFAPEFGRTPGGQISLVTRAGTNVFHGSGSEYFRHTSMDANDWFANARGQAKAKERQNLFGAVVGGPVLQNRLFFFGSFEGLRLLQPATSLVSVPTEELRAQAVASLRPYLDAVPLPNGRTLETGTAEFAASYSNPGSFDVSAVRFDVQAANALVGFVRVSHAPSEAQIRSRSLSTVHRLRVGNDSVTGGVTWPIVSSLTADVRVNWTRNRPQESDQLDTFGGAVVPTVSDVFLPGRIPSGAWFFFGGIDSFGWGITNSNAQRQFNTVGTVAWLTGAHQLKLGVDYRRMLPLLGGPTGLYESLVVRDAQQVLDGRAAYYYVSNADAIPREAVFSNISLYAQDTWRVAHRLTLTYGIRFERVPPPTEARGRLPRTVLGIENDVLQDPRLAPQGTPLWHSRIGEVAPRAGAAYQVSKRAGWEGTLRAGAGVFYDLGLGNVASAFGDVYPFSALSGAFDVSFPLSDAARIPPPLDAGPPGTELSLLDPNLRLPYTAQWHAVWEQALGPAQTVTVAYVGADGRRLLVMQTYVQSLAEWPNDPSVLLVQRNLGRSRYHALQVQYQSRLHARLHVLASYSLARAQDNASASDAFAPANGLGDVLAREFGPSDFDVRQKLSTALTFDIPAPQGPALLRSLLRDWGIDLLLRVQSAFPVNPIACCDGLVGAFYTPSPRPDAVTGQPLYIQDSSVAGGRRFNPAAFETPSPNRQGTFPRNGLRGLPASQMDLALRRELGRFGSMRLQLRAELFNVFNHPNFGPPVADTAAPLFGQPTQMLNRSLGGLSALYQMGGPRSGQLGVKVLF
jgi:hypothetical protein